jgi:serine/threonine-protein kinase
VPGASIPTVGLFLGGTVMPIDSVATLVRMLGQYHLLEPGQFDELTYLLQPQFTEPIQLSRELVQRGWLTPYQVNQLFQAKDQRLTLGSYVLLEKITEGVMGDIFKARHQHMKRIVALQVIRADLLRNDEAVERFYHEVQLASQLSHPHLVASYDAGPVGNTHFFAMEYIDGIDLERHVQQEGPVPVIQACEFIRQAALGLQHAFQRGLRHHDLKPTNLLLSQPKASSSDAKPAASLSGSGANLTWGQVKIRNLGLTVIRQPTKHTRLNRGQANPSTGLRTPDYVAPERIQSGGLCDIRAELYSLGCSLYFLLTGQVPFPGGTAEDKHRRHQKEQPQPIESLRPEVPEQVCAIISKLMAKRPEDRYQTPADAAAALAALPAHVLSGAVANKGWEQRKKVEQQRSRRLMAIGGITLLVGLGLFSLLLSRTFRNNPEPTWSLKPEPKLVAAKNPALSVNCGRPDGWSPFDVVQPGYNVRLYEGAGGGDWPIPNSSDKSYDWYNEKQVRFEVVVPPRTPGELRLSFWSGDNLKRKQRVSVEKKHTEVEDFTAWPPKTVTVPISEFTSRDGKFDVAVANLLPTGSAIVNRVEFFPLIDPEEPQPPGPALIIRCGRGTGNTQVEALARGYSYKLVQGANFDGWPPPAPRSYCWSDGKEVKVELRVPPRTAGKLRLFFTQMKGEGRKQKVLVQGKTIGDFQDFDSGKWVEVPQTAGDTKEGKIEITVQNLVPSINAVISEIEFVPQTP